MSVSYPSIPTIAVLSPFVNYRDLRTSLRQQGLQAQHVIRPSYRESLRWLQDRLHDLQYRVGLPLLFLFGDGETAIAHDASSASAALERMVAASPPNKWW